MVTHKQVRTESAISVIRPAKGIWLVREQSHIGCFYSKGPIIHACATFHELPSNICTMVGSKVFTEQGTYINVFLDGLDI